MKRQHFACFLLLLVLLLAGLSSCLKKDFDRPPDNRGFDPALTVTHSISHLQLLPAYHPIEEDIIVSGIVVMNDQSGNYFRKIVLQDSSGGMEVLVDINNLHYDYPVGRKLYLRCKGLYVGNNADNPQLGYTPDITTGFITGIPALLAGQFIVKASFPHKVVPDTLTLTELSDVNVMHRYLNTLIVLKNIEFDTLSVGLPYASPATISSRTQHKVLDCIERSVLLNTSGYAKFRTALLPAGNGTLTAVYTRYYNQAQLHIRDTSDVQFYGPRCKQMEQHLLYQNFTELLKGEDIELEGWTNYAESGGRKYKKELSGQEHFARITAFGGTSPSAVNTWLITPSVNLSGKYNARLSFKTKDGYDNGASLRVLVSEDYRGQGSPSAASWKALPVLVSNGSTAGYAPEWTVAYTSLAYKVPVHIAFLYEGGAGKTTTFDLTDIKVTSE